MPRGRLAAAKPGAAKLAAAKPGAAKLVATKPVATKPVSTKPAASSSTSPASSTPAAAPVSAAPVVSNSVAPRLFAPDSVWNQSLANDAPLAPSSTAMVNGLVTEVAREVPLNIGPWISGLSHIYSVGANTPLVSVALDNPTPAWRAPLQAAFTAVPIPADAVPEAGSDSEMSIWQPSTDKLWEFFHMRLLADGWHAAWGGAMQHVSQSPGYYTTSSWPGSGSYWGATATSLPHAAGVITQADLQQGQIDHALAVNLPYPRAGAWAWPAQRADGTGTDPNAIPEGAHLRLDPNLNLNALNLSPLVYMMAKAAQKYGMIVRDQTHWAIGFFIQDPTITGGAPYWVNGAVSNTGVFQGKAPSQLMSQFPWSSVQVLNMTLSGPGAQSVVAERTSRTRRAAYRKVDARHLAANHYRARTHRAGRG